MAVFLLIIPKWFKRDRDGFGHERVFMPFWFGRVSCTAHIGISISVIFFLSRFFAAMKVKTVRAPQPAIRVCATTQPNLTFSNRIESIWSGYSENRLNEITFDLAYVNWCIAVHNQSPQPRARADYTAESFTIWWCCRWWWSWCTKPFNANALYRPFTSPAISFCDVQNMSMRNEPRLADGTAMEGRGARQKQSQTSIFLIYM